MAMDFYNRYNVDLNNLIHHSDRGVQYCSNLYVGMLKKHHINISMTPCGDPLHNALAIRLSNCSKLSSVQSKSHPFLIIPLFLY